MAAVANQEVQALMMASGSDSDDDNTEAFELGKLKNGRTTYTRKGNADGRWKRRVVSWGLALSLLANLGLLVSVLVIVRAHSAPADCPQDVPDFGQHSSQTKTPPLPLHDLRTFPTPPPVPNVTCLTSATTCGRDTERVQAPKDDGYINLFRDLTGDEITAVMDYLFSQRSLGVQHHGSRFGTNSVSGVELYVPTKKSALRFLDLSAAQPPREALVTLVVNAASPPVVRQYVVGPLPRPTHHRVNPRMDKQVPASRLTLLGFLPALRHTFQELQRVPGVERLLRASFEVSFSDCNGQYGFGSGACLHLQGQKVSFGLVNTTSFIFTAYYNAEFPTVHPVPFQLLVSQTPSSSSSSSSSTLPSYTISSVFFAGSTFSSLQQLVREATPQARSKYPRGGGSSGGGPEGSMKLRGEPSPPKPHPPPRQYEPRGPRYSVEDGHVKYLQWSFNVRVSVESGPQIWDVRWAGERIVYELSLQEVVVLYAGANPSAMLSHLSDSAFGLGNNAKPLVPGVDCPEHAQFFSTWIFSHTESSSYSKEATNSICVFEHNSGVPLRRHSSGAQQGREGPYYGGLVDHVLIVRAIIVEYNYDYVFDFVFHANGALETKVYATGYIMAQWFHYGEDPFGFQVQQGVVGSVHHHLFHFKVDMDVGGASNRYETLDLAVDDRDWPWLSALKPSATSSSPSSSSSSSSSSYSESSSSARSFQQISFKHHVRKTEKDALYHYNFDRPKYHVFYNNEKKNKFGNVRAYRLEARGFSKQLLPSAHPALRSRKWADHCMAVTEHKDKEMKSSSIFSMYDADDPVVDFDDFIADDDSILDKDLVSWVTLGMHHIPHTEDIPNTPTVGTEASVLLLPYNYFPECPSVRSRDAVRWEGTSPGGYSRFETYGTQSDFACLPPVYGWLTASKAKGYP
ncbi:putative amine oxidase [copper-containing] isoform X2 [Babylonia areolata]|uniref:putative amine oxidase [copper-containing] isoform X2 n=1 Tax=Babylonia areolata TaxID=304850 RepID=UPI003FD4E200